MRRSFLLRVTLVLILALALAPAGGPPPAFATCGGGGGGGLGGATAGRGGAEEVYHVPWKIIKTGAPIPEGDLVLYWFPTSAADARGSDLLSSRDLTMASGRCVGMALVTSDNGALRERFGATADKPLAVLAEKSGKEIGRVPSDVGRLVASSVESLLRDEIDKRESEAKKTLEGAKTKLGAKDEDGAAALYSGVWGQRCLLPGPAKKAAKALKKMGRPLPEAESSRLEGAASPDLSASVTKRIVAVMSSALAAEREGRYLEARNLYSSARKIDPADAVPARYLGELMRHHTGEWAEARTIFEGILAGPADPISRAVALHGLGKMTIHAGDYAKGLALFEESLQAFPLALTYRNLAVYWNSEKQPEKAYGYVRQAMELDPDDEYNQIFAATYYVMLGRPQDAEEVARRHESLLAASYNLAGIYAQLGDRRKALELLRRHFFVYEQFVAVRAKEMKEAREDIVFASLHADPEFRALTSLADEAPAPSKPS